MATIDRVTIHQAVAELDYLSTSLPPEFQDHFYQRALGLACQIVDGQGYAEMSREGQRIIPRVNLDVNSLDPAWPHVSFPVGDDANNLYSILHFHRETEFSGPETDNLDQIAKGVERYEQGRENKLQVQENAVQLLGKETVRDLKGWMMERAVEDVYRDMLPKEFEKYEGSVRVITNVIKPQGMLGQGGQAVVYKGRELSLTGVAREVAYKLWTATKHSDLFRREMGLVTAVVHRNIVDVYGTGVDFNHDPEHGVLPMEDILVMEFIPGKTLADVIQDSRLSGEPFQLREVDEIMRQLARGLQCAHGLGMVHRDIKPSPTCL